MLAVATWLNSSHKLLDSGGATYDWRNLYQLCRRVCLTLRLEPPRFNATAPPRVGNGEVKCRSRAAIVGSFEM